MKNKDEIVVPLELVEGKFNLVEIGTIGVLLASPYLDSDYLLKWGQNEELLKSVDKLIDDGIVYFTEDENGNKITNIDLENKNMNGENVSVEKAIRDLAKNHGYLEEDLKVIRSYMEDVAFTSYSMGYTDAEIDYQEKIFQSYGKKEDF